MSTDKLDYQKYVTCLDQILSIIVATINNSFIFCSDAPENDMLRQPLYDRLMDQKQEKPVH